MVINQFGDDRPSFGALFVDFASTSPSPAITTPTARISRVVRFPGRGVAASVAEASTFANRRSLLVRSVPTSEIFAPTRMWTH
jgi:hypothetical protein